MGIGVSTNVNNNVNEVVANSITNNTISNEVNCDTIQYNAQSIDMNNITCDGDFNANL